MRVEGRALFIFSEVERARPFSVEEGRAPPFSEGGRAALISEGGRAALFSEGGGVQRCAVCTHQSDVPIHPHMLPAALCPQPPLLHKYHRDLHPSE